jgi:hypothetical protein
LLLDISTHTIEGISEEIEWQKLSERDSVAVGEADRWSLSLIVDGILRVDLGP